MIVAFTSRSRIFHSHKESPYPTKGRPVINNNHSLFICTLFQSLKLSSKMNLTILIICHSQPGWLILHEPLIFQKFYQRPDHYHNSVSYVQPNGYTLSVSSHTSLLYPVTPLTFSSAYGFKKFMLYTGKKLNQ